MKEKTDSFSLTVILGLIILSIVSIFWYKGDDAIVRAAQSNNLEQITIVDRVPYGLMFFRACSNREYAFQATILDSKNQKYAICFSWWGDASIAKPISK